VGRDGVIASSKIEPLSPSLDKGKDGQVSGEDRQQGLDDAAVDGARVEPLGEVKDEYA
jgi:hypothetical protein